MSGNTASTARRRDGSDGTLARMGYQAANVSTIIATTSVMTGIPIAFRTKYHGTARITTITEAAVSLNSGGISRTSGARAAIATAGSRKNATKTMKTPAV